MMNLVQSFWSKPLLTPDYLMRHQFSHYVDRFTFYLSYALSTLLAKEHYNHISFVSDRNGLFIFNDLIGLPFSNISDTLDKINNYPSEFWALGKIIAYSEQKQPFIHIDFDLFIPDRFPERIELAQNVAYAFEGLDSFLRNTYSSKIETIKENSPKLYGYEEVFECINPLNAGIIGGHNLDVFEELKRMALDFIKNNCHIVKISKNEPFCLNVIFEQWFYGYILSKSNINAEILIDTAEWNCSTLNDLYVGKIVHLMGNAKGEPHTATHVHYLMRTRYPEYYERIERLVYDSII